MSLGALGHPAAARKLVPRLEDLRRHHAQVALACHRVREQAWANESEDRYSLQRRGSRRGLESMVLRSYLQCRTSRNGYWCFSPDSRLRCARLVREHLGSGEACPTVAAGPAHHSRTCEDGPTAIIG
jgi:hypothetical protein